MNEEFQKFDGVMKKVLTVSHDELKRREAAWQKQRQRQRAQQKRARTSPASRASSGKG
jgi:hypothetical protein